MGNIPSSLQTNSYKAWMGCYRVKARGYLQGLSEEVKAEEE
jgi:hypothetical protein